MSITHTSTGHVSRAVKRGGLLDPGETGGKKLRISTNNSSNTKMDSDLPPVPPKQVTPNSESKKRKQLTNEGETAKSGAEQKCKSMRRSSFVRGRISMVMPITTTPQLCSNIPQDLPEDERLMKLSMSVLEHTLRKLSNEFSTFDGMQQFKVQARDAVSRTVEALKENGTLASFTVTDSRAPNPVNVELDKAIKTYEDYIKKLKTENERWDSLVELRRRLAEDAEREEVTAADDVITEPVAPLSVEQETFLSKKPNYKGMLDELKSFREQALIAANEMHEGTKVMDRLMEIANVVVQEQANLLHIHSFESIKNFDSPRSLIGNLD